MRTQGGRPAPIAIIGGTGKLGTALGARLALAGEHVVLGSRDAARAVSVARDLQERLEPSAHGRLSGAGNAAATSAAAIAILAVPYEGLDAILEDVAGAARGRVVVSAVVPVRFVKGKGPEHIEVAEGSACQHVALRLQGSRVVGALQTVSSVTAADLDAPMHGDVLLTGDDARAKSLVAGLVNALPGVRAVDGGPLHNARYVEQLTVLLLSINRTYRRNTGVTIVNLPDSVVSWGANGA